MEPISHRRAARAIAACTRALVEIDNADTLLAQSNAATHSGLRAFADRVVLQRRFHDGTIHSQHRPQEAEAADLFDALEQARLDSIGAQWLPGIARNLVAHPGAEDDGVRWLAFVVLSGRPAPKDKSALIARVKAALPNDVLDELGALRTRAQDQSGFAEGAAAWVRAASAYVPRQQTKTATDQTFTLPLRDIDKYQRRGRCERPVGAGSRREKKEREGHSGADANASPAGAVVEPPCLEIGYRVFTTAHDRVVNAAALASRDELEQLRRTLDAELSATRTTVARLAKKLLRVLMARQVT